MNIFRSLPFFVLVSALSFSSCSDDEAEIQSHLVEKTFYVGTSSNESRAAIYDYSNQITPPVYWTSGDFVSVFPIGKTASNYKFEYKGGIDNQDDSYGKFQGTTLSDETKFFILYPWQKGAHLDEQNRVFFNIPCTQSAINGTFDPAAGVQLGDAASDAKYVDLKNMCAYFSLTVKPGCTGVRIETVKQDPNKTETSWIPETSWHLAGDVYASVGSAGNKIEVFGECQNYVELSGIPQNASADETYIMAFIPTTGTAATGDSPRIRVTITGDETKNSGYSTDIVRIIKPAQQFAAGVVYNLGTYPKPQSNG